MNKITNNDEETFGETLNNVILGIVKLLRRPIIAIMFIPHIIGKFGIWIDEKVPFWICLFLFLILMAFILIPTIW